MSEWSGIRDGGVVFEDEAVLVLNKPAGISVMGERHETDLVRLAAAAGEELFPVHRIDKVTSGAVLFAKQLRWHGPLTRQFAGRTVGKTYLAITAPGGLPARGVIDLPLSTGRKSRVRVAAPRASIVADADRGTWSDPETEDFGHERTYPSVTAFARVGFSGDFGGTWLMTRLVGPARAKEFYFLADPIEANQALALGLVNRVVPAASLTAEAAALAKRIASGPAIAYGYMKANINAALTADFRTLLDREAVGQTLTGRTEDHKEAVKAFLEKRQPTFTGR